MNKGWRSGEIGEQRNATAYKLGSTLPFFYGFNFQQAANNAARNLCGIWRPFEVSALELIAAGHFRFKRGKADYTWHVMVDDGHGLELVFLFVKRDYNKREGYHIIYEPWHARKSSQAYNSKLAAV